MDFYFEIFVYVRQTPEEAHSRSGTEKNSKKWVLLFDL